MRLRAIDGFRAATLHWTQRAVTATKNTTRLARNAPWESQRDAAAA